MYFAPQQDFINTKVFLPPELQYQPNKKTGITLSMVNSDRQLKRPKGKFRPDGPLGSEVKVKSIILIKL